MTYEKNLLEPVELNELELDAVAGGNSHRGGRPEQDGFINVQVRDVDVQAVVAVQALAANSQQDVFAPFEPE